MSSLNKILVLFMSMLFLTVIAGWNILQGEWVATKISHLVTELIKDKYDTDIALNNFRFNLFPPGVQAKNVRVKGEFEGLKVDVAINDVGLYFSTFDVFRTKLMADIVEIQDGYVHISRIKERTKSKTKPSDIAFKPIDFNMLEKIPINKIKINKIDLKYNEYEVTLTKLITRLKKSRVVFDGRLQNVDLSQIIRKNKVIDSIAIRGEIDQEKLSIDSLDLKESMLSVGVKGSVKNYLSRNVQYELEGALIGPIQKVHEYLDFRKIGNLNKGTIDSTFKLVGTGQQFDLTTHLKLKDFVTDFLYGEILTSTININNKRVKFNTLEMLSDDESISLKKPFEFYNFSSGKFVEEPILANTNNLKFTNFLRFLRKDISMIDGRLSGDIKFDLGANDFHFSPIGSVTVNNLSLDIGSEEKLLNIKRFEVSKGSFDVDQGLFTMDFDAQIDDTNFTMKAAMGNKRFELEMPHGFIDLEKIGPILGFPIEGRGNLSFKMFKNIDKKLILQTNGDFKSFSFDNYKLDVIKANVDFLVSDNSVLIKKLNGSSGKAKIYTDGLINYKTNKIRASYVIQNLNFTEAKRILFPVLGKSSLTANEIYGRWDSSGKISGLMNINKIKMYGKLESKNSFIYEESIDDIKCNYNLENSIFNLTDFHARKGYGRVSGNLKYNLKNSSMVYNTSLRNVYLDDISYYNKLPLELEGTLNGDSKGSINDKKKEFSATFELSNTSNQSKRFASSKLSLSYKNDAATIRLSGFGKKIDIGANIYFDKERAMKSNLSMDLSFSNLRRTLGVFGGVDELNSSLSGKINYSLKSNFNVLNGHISDLTSHVKLLEIKKDKIYIKHRSVTPEFVVKDGVIDKWDMNIRGKNAYIVSKGSGVFAEKYDLLTRFKVDAGIIEVFNKVFSKVGGNIRGRIHNFNKNKKNNYEAIVSSDNLSLNTSLLPTAITNGNVKIEYKNKKLFIRKFKTTLTSGSFNLQGLVDLRSVIPGVSLKYEFLNASVPILKKSDLIFSGNGSVTGKRFPYDVTGNFEIKKFIFVNEFTDLGSGEDSVIKKDVEFLPRRSKEVVDEMLNLNVNVKTLEPILINNSIADLGFQGDLQIVGGEKITKVIGKLELSPRTNKVSFKNNTFFFTKGDVLFSEEEEVTNPSLDFWANAKINNYKVNVKLLGPVQDFSLDFRSDPVLSQSDILSLIAFGYTENLSNNLSDSEKESMTRAGVGSIIFDSFKINETLKNEFGLQVNLGTEISEEGGSYLSQRDASGSSSVGRVKSATTFEVKKQLDDDLSLSVSSTVGTSSNQKQSMNLNYNVNRVMSLEGIYESSTYEDSLNDTRDISVGADVKWRWTFR